MDTNIHRFPHIQNAQYIQEKGSLGIVKPQFQGARNNLYYSSIEAGDFAIKALYGKVEPMWQGTLADLHYEGVLEQEALPGLFEFLKRVTPIIKGRISDNLVKGVHNLHQFDATGELLVVPRWWLDYLIENGKRPQSCMGIKVTPATGYLYPRIESARDLGRFIALDEVSYEIPADPDP